jgi:Xaa-Pro aminopeptidase
MAQIKTLSEIEYIAHACTITDAIFAEVVMYIKNQKKYHTIPTEIQIQKYILQKIKDRKLRSAFPPIVTSGKNAGNEIHPQSTDHPVQGFVIIDLGVRYQGYCSDMTRMLYVGTPTQTEKNLYQHMLDAQILVSLLIKT